MLKIFMVSCFVFIFLDSQLYSQVQVDTIPITETFLEDRHISYIYDFAYNSAMHKYRSLMPLKGADFSFPRKSDKSAVLVISDILPTDIVDLELFIFTDSTDRFTLLENSQNTALENQLITQFEMVYLPPFNTQLKEYFPKVQEAIKENVDADFAVAFSELYMRDHFIYVFVGLTFERGITNYLPGAAHIFEFEWCKSMEVIYPRRVSTSNFHRLNLTLASPMKKIGGTIEIPSLKCYPSEK